LHIFNCDIFCTQLPQVGNGDREVAINFELVKVGGELAAERGQIEVNELVRKGGFVLLAFDCLVNPRIIPRAQVQTSHIVVIGCKPLWTRN
jgi:hypothetical protein